MIRVYVNGEWVMTFQSQAELDTWVQRCDSDFFMNNQVEYEYED